jgi:hypothetical protein
LDEATVLIVAQHSVIGALLGSLVELGGHRAVFPHSDELPSAAIGRIGPRLTLIDSDHPFSTDPRLFEQARIAHSAMLMFSSTLNGHDTESVAAKWHLKSFTLPIRYRDFRDLMETTLDPLVRLPFETTGEHGAAASL